MIMHRSFADHMGFNWPKWIAMIVDGKPISFLELLYTKREKQDAHLEDIRRDDTIQLKPCLIWVFYNDGFPYGGWWLYVRTLNEDYPIGFRKQNKELTLKIMELFPSGCFPFIENLDEWMEAFAEIYHRSTLKRKKQGMVKAWAQIQHGQLIDILKNNSTAQEFVKEVG